MNCIFLRRGYPEVNKGPDYSDNFADNDWATIIAVCQAGLIPDSWKVGDQKAMTINGASYPIDIIGIQHDDYSDGSGKAPFTFQFHNCYNTTYQMTEGYSSSNVGGWEYSAMRTSYLPAILLLMPSEVQAAIKEVNKLTSLGNQNSTIYTSTDKLFLPSIIEVIGSDGSAKSGEGTIYAYYSAGNSMVKNVNSSANNWWTRSPFGYDAVRFCFVGSSGDIGEAFSIQKYGIAPAFCF